MFGLIILISVIISLVVLLFMAIRKNEQLAIELSTANSNIKIYSGLIDTWEDMCMGWADEYRELEAKVKGLQQENDDKNAELDKVKFEAAEAARLAPFKVQAYDLMFNDPNCSQVLAAYFAIERGEDNVWRIVGTEEFLADSRFTKHFTVPGGESFYSPSTKDAGNDEATARSNLIKHCKTKYLREDEDFSDL